MKLLAMVACILAVVEAIQSLSHAATGLGRLAMRVAGRRNR